MAADTVVHRAARSRARAAPADPVITEIIRHALNSAAGQMRRTLTRCAFSAVIYEVLDFAAALYDADIRLLAQAPSLPLFMGTLSDCVREAVAAVGGTQTLRDGDVIVYNWPYGTGSHPQDVAMVMPVFQGEMLVGYAAVKAHWLDIGGKDPYSTDTIDVHQEGTLYPGFKICRAGVIDESLKRMILANSRTPAILEGDMHAQIAAVQAGAAALLRVLSRFPSGAFWAAVEQLFDHAERQVRAVLAALPDGRYAARGQCDDDGIAHEPVPFDVSVEIAGSDIIVDFTAAPPSNRGPLNTPAPSTVAASRIAVAMLAGSAASPNEGHFRPVTVLTRPGTMFHAEAPTPVFLYGLPALQAMEVVFAAIACADPKAVPAASGGCLVGMTYWGTRGPRGLAWADGSPHPVGQGATAVADGSTSMHHALAATRFSPIEVWEARNPWIAERCELAQNSGGAGRHRGGLGIDFAFRMLEDVRVTASLERTKAVPAGLAGGHPGRPNSAVVTLPDGSSFSLAKQTNLVIPAGALLEIHTGGGGGHGPPGERDPAAVAKDLRDGYVTTAIPSAATGAADVATSDSAIAGASANTGQTVQPSPHPSMEGRTTAYPGGRDAT